jgi:nicotinamidase-related amidase
MSKVALLIIDMQKQFKKECSDIKQFDKSIEYINEVSHFFRKNSLPIVVIQDNEALNSENNGFDCVDNLVLSDTDLKIYKNYNNAFWKTDLNSILKENEVDCVIVSGFAAEHCALFTYNGAKERGYQAFLLQNGISGINEIDINRIHLLRSVISYEAIEYFIK